MSAVTILGIDPGTATTGWGVIRADGQTCSALAYGAILTPKEHARGERLRAIHDQVGALLREHAPDALACERLFFTKNVATAMAVGEARGIILLAAAQHNVPFHDYTPTDVKQSLSGSGRADKKEMQQMVAWTLDLPKPPRPDDVADALAIALCHLFHVRLSA